MLVWAPLANRASSGAYKLPEDGYYEIIPPGNAIVQVTGRLQVLDDKSRSSIVANFAAQKEKNPRHKIRVDWDHFSYQPDKPSKAAGWIPDLVLRNGSVFAKIDWTPDGEKDVTDGSYRYGSPSWWPWDYEELTEAETRALLNDAPKILGPADRRPAVRPLRIDSLGLTNNPNFVGIEPLSNRSGRGDQPHVDRPPTPNNRMKSVATLLGLSEDASETSIHLEVTRLQSRATAAEKRNEPVLNRVKELEAENKTLLEAQVETDLEKFKDRIDPKNTENVKRLLLSNRASAIAMLESISATPDYEDRPGAPNGIRNRVHDVANARNPAERITGKPGVGKGALDYAQINSRANELIANRVHRDFTMAFLAAEMEAKAAAGIPLVTLPTPARTTNAEANAVN